MNKETIWFDQKKLEEVRDRWIKEMPEDITDPTGVELEDVIESFLMSIVKMRS